jgi:hypothetical protein
LNKCPPEKRLQSEPNKRATVFGQRLKEKSVFWPVNINSARQQMTFDSLYSSLVLVMKEKKY